MKPNRYKMVTVKGQTVVCKEGSDNVKFMGEGKEGVLEALRYLEYLRFINRVHNTYQTTITQRLYRVDRLVPVTLSKTLIHMGVEE